jgi:hypothetical protein
MIVGLRAGKDAMTSDEGMMNAARVMRDAAETNQRAADRIEEAVRQMQILFDAGYGGTAPRLLEELEKANAPAQWHEAYLTPVVRSLDRRKHS